MVRTLVLALRMHSNRVVKRFLNYHGNSKFALQLPLVNPPLVFVVRETAHTWLGYTQTARAHITAYYCNSLVLCCRTP